MKEVDGYKVVWNPNVNEGSILLNVPGGVERLHLGDAAEGLLLIDILRNEKPVYVNDGILFTGFEPVGEGEEGSA